METLRWHRLKILSDLVGMLRFPYARKQNKTKKTCSLVPLSHHNMVTTHMITGYKITSDFHIH